MFFTKIFEWTVVVVDVQGARIEDCEGSQNDSKSIEEIFGV